MLLVSLKEKKRKVVLLTRKQPVVFNCVQSGGSEQERTKKKRRGDRYSVQTSLIVAALKKMLPIGLNMCSPADQELINIAKIRYSLVPAPGSTFFLQGFRAMLVFT